MSLTNDLNCRVTLYTRQEKKNGLGDTTYAYAPFCTLWAKISPTGDRTQTLPGGTEALGLRHSIVIRANALPHPATDLYLVYKGRRYNVDSWRPHYRHPDRVELLCTMETDPVEVEPDDPGGL